MSYTFALSDHPLKKLIENAYLNAPEQEQSNPVNKSKKAKERKVSNNRKITEIIKKNLNLRTINDINSISEIESSVLDKINYELFEANVDIAISRNNKYYYYLLELKKSLDKK
ncbi:hypothetical protein AB733_23905 [Photobacterium swingsii]|nr:hypothetical protein [Photobacterium swingsii]KMV28405.1 hypothetical protein AB733_23905 [Photobacterium swingsii]